LNDEAYDTEYRDEDDEDPNDEDPDDEDRYLPSLDAGMSSSLPLVT
jgi:hypothetical protein